MGTRHSFSDFSEPVWSARMWMVPKIFLKSSKVWSIILMYSLHEFCAFLIYVYPSVVLIIKYMLRVYIKGFYLYLRTYV
jgi:hypothetical protein